jgi:hypothetical protein
MESEQRPEFPECEKGITRDDLRYFLFMKEAGAILDPDAEAVAQHLERDDCGWCLRENAFLYWTEPGLTAAGRKRYNELVNGLRDEQLEEPELEAPGEQPLEVVAAPAAAQSGSHLDFAVWSVHTLLAEPAAGNSEQYCANILGIIQSCFPPTLTSEQREEVAKRVRPQFNAAFQKLPNSLKTRAGECAYPSASRRALALLRELAENNEDLMVAVALQIASLIPSAQPFPLVLKGGRVWLDFGAYQSAMQPRVSTADAR